MEHDMATRRIPFYKALYLSFYSRELYGQVAHFWRGLGFLYLLFLVAVTSLPLTYSVYRVMDEFLKTQGEYVIEQMPVVTIQNGKLSIPNTQPYFVYLPDRTPLIIFDNTGQYTLENMKDVMAVATATHIHVRQREHEIRSYDVSTVKEEVIIDQGMVHKFADVAKSWFAPIFFFMATATFFVLRILQSLIYGLIGLAFNAALGAKLQYPQLVRLAVMALTPVLVFDSVLLLLGQSPISSLLGIIVSLGYLYYGVRANQNRLV